MNTGIANWRELPEIKFSDMPAGAQSYWVRNSEALFHVVHEVKAMGFASWAEVPLSRIGSSPRVFNALSNEIGERLGHRERDFTLGDFFKLEINERRIPNFGVKSIAEFLGNVYAFQFYWDKSEPKIDHSDIIKGWTVQSLSAKDLKVIRDAENWRALVGWVNSRVEHGKKGIVE